jgi:GGDEF domain-containing protein
MRVSIATRWAEGFGAGAVVGLLGLLNPSDPAFSGLGFLPQALVSVLAAALLGAAPGAFALVGAVLATVALPYIGGLLGIDLAAQPRGLLEAARLPAAAVLGCVIAAGSLRDGSMRSTLRLLRRVRDLVRRNVQFKKMNAALSSLSEELERRVSGQRDSVSALYTRIRKMDSHDMDTVMSGLLEAVQAFSQASAAAVYEYDPMAQVLVRLASIGPEAEASLPLDGSIAGWVFRNDSTFSLRNVDDYLNLAHADYRNSILAYPIKAGGLPWGVLNVSEMPFYRYNPITERNLGIVLELASSYIKTAADFRDRALRHPHNEITGLPTFGELLRMLGDELARRAERRLSVSLVIVELLGFEGLASERSVPKAFALLKEFAERAVADDGGRAFAFHFREDGQLAFLLPDIDRGGASLFCLGLIEKAGASQWQIDGESACVEIAFGLASFPDAAEAEGEAGPEGRTEALIAEAEEVLARSKGAYVEHGGRCP